MKSLKCEYAYGLPYMTYKATPPYCHTEQRDKNSFLSYRPATKPYCFQGCFGQF